MSHLRVPYQALELAHTPVEIGAIVDLYRRADKARWRPFTLATLDFRAGGLSARRAVEILAHLEEDGLLKVVDAGGPRSARKVALRDPTTGVFCLPDSPAERSNTDGVSVVDESGTLKTGAERKPERWAERSNADGNVIVDDSGTQTGTQAGTPNRARAASSSLHPTEQQLPQTPSPDGEGATLPEPDQGWERLPARTRTALTEADVHSLPQLAALTEEQVRAIPGVGSKARRQLRAALQAAGLDYAPEPEPEVDLSQRRQNRAERACSDIFAEAWRRRFDTAYAWDLAANGRDRDRRRRLVAIARLNPESQADRDRLGKAVLAYLADHAAGRAWPKDEPPSFRRFVDRAGDYLSGAVPLPTAGPATDAAATVWARVLAEVQAHGRNACEQAPPPVLHALAAVGGAHRLAGMTAFDLGRLWPAFRDAYHRGAA